MGEIAYSLEKILQKGFRFLLFISSYIPLFIILFLKNIGNLQLTIVFIIIIIIPLFVIKKYIDLPLKYESNRKIYIKKVTNKGSEALNNVVCYIIPFISFNSDVIKNEWVDIPNLLAILVLFLVICNLYMSNNLYYINPIITLFYDIHSIQDDKDKTLFLITDKGLSIEKDKMILTRALSPNIFLYTDKRENMLKGKKILILFLFLLSFLFIWNNVFREFVLQVTNMLVACSW